MGPRKHYITVNLILIIKILFQFNCGLSNLTSVLSLMTSFKLVTSCGSVIYILTYIGMCLYNLCSVFVNAVFLASLFYSSNVVSVVVVVIL